MRKRGQSLVEFAIIIPLLVVLIFSIIEFSIYWTTVNAVEGIAMDASTKMASIHVSEAAGSNPAVDMAVLSIADNSKYLGEKMVFGTPSITGTEPFALYKYESNQTRDTVNGIKPMMTVTIDYRDPYKDGIILQLSYQYRTILLGASIPIPGNDPIVIIPRDIMITSKKNQQYNSY